MKAGARFSLKIATKACFIESSHQSFFRSKKLLKLRFLDYYFETKTEELDQEDWSVSVKFGIITLCSGII